MTATAAALTPLDAVRAAAGALARRGVPSPRADAEILVAHVLGLTRSGLYAADGELTPDEGERLRALLARRAAREPLAYVLGEWGFRRLTLAVDRRVLVPRPETEVVVERCLALLRGLAHPRVLDVGTGSGAIALAIADERPGARVVALDASADALAVAAENARRSGLAERVQLVHGDVRDGFGGGPFDLVVSNPPYVGADEIETLEPEVRDHEPREALLGAGVLEALARGAHEALRPDRRLVVECGDGQAPEAALLLRRQGYADVRTTCDLAGVERVVEGRRP